MFFQLAVFAATYAPGRINSDGRHEPQVRALGRRSFRLARYTSEDLYRMNKVLNEADMPPLWVVRDMVRHLKLLRRKKDVLLPTKRGQDFLARPQAFFDLIATDYLYAYIHHGQTQEAVRNRMRWWHVFLNLINMKAETGCSLDELANELYPSESYPEPAEMTVETWQKGRRSATISFARCAGWDCCTKSARD
ncbi:hypothetical protein ILFOPFJJ_01776 [Ensifer psoraleae]|nr:hypothetical protein [Sinorhizobium psoraleae]